MSELTVEQVETQNLMKVWKTVTGMTLETAVKELMAVLPPQAYRPVPGGADLTDIDPHFLTQVATKVFGLIGTGWRYDYVSGDIRVSREERSTRSGNTRIVYTAVVPYLTIQYRYFDEEGTLVWSSPIPANGASENENEGFAIRGALTNAIGAAFAKLCWQLPVYLGMVDHRNAGEQFRKAQAKKNGNGYTAQPENGNGRLTEAELAVLPVPENTEEKVAWAEKFVIPENIGVPLAGKTLGEARKEQMGIHVIKFLTGRFPNARQVLFEPEGEYQAALKAAATFLLEVEEANRKK